jgi:hypothetical protein
MPPPGQHRRWMIDDQFRRWVMVPVSTPSVPEDLHAALSETEELPEMIDIVREAELSCMRLRPSSSRRSRMARPRATCGSGLEGMKAEPSMYPTPDAMYNLSRHDFGAGIATCH